MTENHSDPLEGTGFQDGPAATWVSIKLFDEGEHKDKCRMVVGKNGPSTDSFTGQLLSAHPAKWSEGTGKIKPHYEYVFTARAKDKSGEIKTYNFSLSGHWKSPILSDILNPLLWLAAQKKAGLHNGLFKLNTYQKRTDSDMYVMRAGVYDPNNAGSNAFMPGKFPWVGTKTDGKFEGVPEPTTDNKGQKDFTSISNFWHEQWGMLVALLGGSNAAPAPTPQPKPTPPAATSAVPDTSLIQPKVVQDAMVWFKKQWDEQGNKTEAGFMSLVTKIFAMCKDPKRATPVTILELDDLATALNTFAKQAFMIFPVGQVIGSDGTLINDPASGFQSNAAATPTPPADDDGLPF